LLYISPMDEPLLMSLSKNCPSSSAEITALVYHPSEHLIVSCSVDSTFKVWVTGAGIQENSGKESTWRCRSVGSYRHKEMYSAAFAPDGSLLGVSTEELVTLWNPSSNGFVTSLACVPSPQKITLLAFVHDSKCLVAASAGARPRLIVWHLPTLSVLWSCFVHVEALSVDPKSSCLGIIALAHCTEKGKLHKGDEGSRKATVALFSPFNSTPTAAWSIQQVSRSLLLDLHFCKVFYNHSVATSSGRP
jgi:NET1-associated nuclear protein 1 (U3 small nucleolar RNA-associated protein 17)